MKFSDIPVYNDPTDFDGNEVKYPCNTQFMVYNPLQHKYFLTEEALNYYGIDVARKYISDNTNKTREFIEKVTKKVYDYIAYKSGWKLLSVQQFRIATAQGKMYDHYEYRKQFEMALVAQAKYLLVDGDSANYSINNLESGVFDRTKPEEDFMDTGDIAPETKRTLHFLGLDRWFSVVQYGRLNTDEY
jgi:hypothetical protein